MGLKKIPKKVWMKLTEDQKRYYELEYNKAFERNKRFTIISTRVIAVICVLALFFVGFAMINATKEIGIIKDKYGPQAYCYLCGLETLKSCECEYVSTMYDKEDYKLEKNYSLELAEANTKRCVRSKVVGSQEGDSWKDDLEILE
jgi:hypothetical protein